jgi:hypothetical protein
MIENIIGNNLNIIIKSRIVKDEKKYMKYIIDKNNIQKYYFLSIRNCDKINNDYNYDLFKIFNINKPNNYEKYSFGQRNST